jgi:hypothetical protein
MHIVVALFLGGEKRGILGVQSSDGRWLPPPCCRRAIAATLLRRCIQAALSLLPCRYVAIAIQQIPHQNVTSQKLVLAAQRW